MVINYCSKTSNKFSNISPMRSLLTLARQVGEKVAAEVKSLGDMARNHQLTIEKKGRDHWKDLTKSRRDSHASFHIQHAINVTKELMISNTSALQESLRSRDAIQSSSAEDQSAIPSYYIEQQGGIN